MSVDYNNMDSMIGAFNKIIKVSTTGTQMVVPSVLILSGVAGRPGLSALNIASKIIARKAEAGLNVGPLPSGAVAPDEIMIRIIVEEIIKSLQQDGIIRVAIAPGIVVNSLGSSPSGPVTTVGASTQIASGYGIIQ